MAYLLVFALAIGGYSLVDWGYQRSKSRRVTMWYLLSGQTPSPSSSASQSGAIQGLTGAPIGGVNPLTGQPYGGVVQSGINPRGTLQ